jgi:hypothetical protein
LKFAFSLLLRWKVAIRQKVVRQRIKGLLITTF